MSPHPSDRTWLHIGCYMCGSSTYMSACGMWTCTHVEGLQVVVFSWVKSTNRKSKPNYLRIMILKKQLICRRSNVPLLALICAYACFWSFLTSYRIKICLLLRYSKLVLFMKLAENIRNILFHDHLVFFMAKSR